jgi:transposase
VTLRYASPRPIGLMLTFLLFATAAPCWSQTRKPLVRTPAASRTTPVVQDSATAQAPELIDVGGRLVSGPFLPDTAVLASVDGKPIRVREYIGKWFKTVEYRPHPDSTGRVEFLNTMIDKEVLGAVARASNRPLSFEDRSVMREFTERALSNVLFQRAVVDSVREPSEAEIRRVYEQMKYGVRLRRMLFSDRDQAERVRADLARRKVTWAAAAARYADVTRAMGSDSSARWFSRMLLPPRTAQVIFELQPGAISPVINEDLGYAVYHVLERREVKPPSWAVYRGRIRDELRTLQVDAYREEMLEAMRKRAGVTHDTTNIRWAASQFAAPLTTKEGEHGPAIEINEVLPEFRAADTARVLARHPNGAISLGRFMELYRAMPSLMRPPVHTAEAFRVQVDVFLLEPTSAEMAKERGLERDPMTVAMVEGRREELLVEHLYADSILARVAPITDAMRRKYYQENTGKFMTYPKVEYAMFQVGSRPAADSLAADLRAGISADDILRKDALAGRQRGVIEERSSEDHGRPYEKLLFGELRPGQVSVEGPSREGRYDIIQLRTFDPGKQLSYEEGERYIDETLRGIESEKLLKAFLQRHRRQARIEAHPELVMQIRLVDSSS